MPPRGLSPLVDGSVVVTASLDSASLLAISRDGAPYVILYGHYDFNPF